MPTDLSYAAQKIEEALGALEDAMVTLDARGTARVATSRATRDRFQSLLRSLDRKSPEFEKLQKAHESYLKADQEENERHAKKKAELESEYLKKLDELSPASRLAFGYEGNESLADVYPEAAEAVDIIRKVSPPLDRVAKKLSRVRGASYSGNPDGDPIYPNSVDHGYEKPVAGGSDVMQDLVGTLRHEQGLKMAQRVARRFLTR